MELHESLWCPNWLLSSFSEAAPEFLKAEQLRENQTIFGWATDILIIFQEITSSNILLKYIVGPVTGVWVRYGARHLCKKHFNSKFDFMGTLNMEDS